jgi:DNA polymerase III subunit delta
VYYPSVKIAAKDALNKIASAKAMLIYGEDSGDVNSLALQIKESILGKNYDPLNFILPANEDVAKESGLILSELMTMSFFGGVKFIWVKNADNKATDAAETLLGENTKSAGFVLLTAGSLEASSKLRKLFEKEDEFLCVPLYGKTIPEMVVYIKSKLNIAPDASMWLANHFEGNFGMLQMEVEKLAIYGEKIDLDTLQKLNIGDGLNSGFNTVIDALLNKKTASFLDECESFIMLGESQIPIIRVIYIQFQRVYYVLANMNKGDNQEVAMKKLYPPVFWKEKDRFVNLINKFASKQNKLHLLMSLIYSAELESKKSSSDITLLRRNLLRISAEFNRV